VTKQELGGAMTHNEKSGVAHFHFADDADGCAMIRELVSFLPSNNLEDPPRRATSDSDTPRRESLNTLVPKMRETVRHQGRIHRDRGRRLLL
jgi:propionyl-CoA carboxylase beta chain